MVMRQNARRAVVMGRTTAANQSKDGHCYNRELIYKSLLLLAVFIYKSLVSYSLRLYIKREGLGA
jgi:hypothetical protein